MSREGELEKLQREFEEENKQLLREFNRRQFRPCFIFIASVWVLSGLGLFWANEDVRIFSSNGATYFIIGTLIYGWLIGHTMRIVNSFLGRYVLPLITGYVSPLKPERPSKGYNFKVAAIGWALWIVFAVLTFQLAEFTVSGMAQIMGG